MIISRPLALTNIDIWAPKYSEADGWHVLLSKYKVHHATGVMLVRFTKAKHLAGQRFCITRDKAQRCAVVSNGKIECYSVPFSLFETWDTAAEVAQLAEEIFND